MNFLDLIWLIPLFPAIGFVVNGLIGKRLPKTVVGAIAAGHGSSLIHIFCRRRSTSCFSWIRRIGRTPSSYTNGSMPGLCAHQGGPLARFAVDWAFLLDPLSSIMILVVTGIGFLIHVYSTGYMHDEDGFYRFFAYLNLFMFSMLTLVLGATT